MEKLFLSAAVVFAAVAGTTYYNSKSKNEMSDLAKANVKALAEEENSRIPQMCYNAINANINYGEVVVVNYCGSCSSKPASKFWNEAICYKNK